MLVLCLFGGDYRYHSTKTSHDSIYCDCECQGWINRRCAGLFKLAFSKLCDSSNQKPIYCPNCHLEQQFLEISELKSTLSKVVCELDEFKPNASVAPSPFKCSQTSMEHPCRREGSQGDVPLLYSRVLTTDSPTKPVATNESPTIRFFARPHGATTFVDEKKFNLHVVYGIKECEKGMVQVKRVLSDIESVCK